MFVNASDTNEKIVQNEVDGLVIRSSIRAGEAAAAAPAVEGEASGSDQMQALMERLQAKFAAASQ